MSPERFAGVLEAPPTGTAWPCRFAVSSILFFSMILRAARAPSGSSEVQNRRKLDVLVMFSKLSQGCFGGSGWRPKRSQEFSRVFWRRPRGVSDVQERPSKDHVWKLHLTMSGRFSSQSLRIARVSLRDWQVRGGPRVTAPEAPPRLPSFYS